MNSKVTHIIWGAGDVVSIDGRYIHVDFEGEIGCRMFVYPDAFERYLKYEDAELQSEVTAKLEARRLDEQKKLEVELAAKKKAAEIAAQKQLEQTAKRRRALAYSRARSKALIKKTK